MEPVIEEDLYKVQFSPSNYDKLITFDIKDYCSSLNKIEVMTDGDGIIKLSFNVIFIIANPCNAE